MEKWETARKNLFKKHGVAEEYAKLFPVKIAARIIRARTKRGLTQRELAELAGTSQSAIARLESGSYDGYTLRTLRKIAEVLGQTVEVVFKSKAA